MMLSIKKFLDMKKNEEPINLSFTPSNDNDPGFSNYDLLEIIRIIFSENSKNEKERVLNNNDEIFS